MNVQVRIATMADVPALNQLIELSARELSVGFYTAQEIDAAIRYVFGVDTTLLSDGTYFVAEVDGTAVGCGGWSRRRTLYGGDQRPVGAAALLDPRTDAARIRAFFVHPRWARRGIGRRILDACVQGARSAEFSRFELMATLPGVAFYEAEGFRRVEDVVDTLPDGTSIRFVRMVDDERE
jgi:N-acetylglutamate synthase-like GNAT family acetyltransferase